MSDDFSPLLKNCELSFGAIDEAPAKPGVVNVSVAGATGPSHDRTFDAVGIEPIGEGTVVLLGFNWLEIDEPTARELLEAEGLSSEEVESELEQLLGEQLLILAEIIPWTRVGSIGMSGGVRGFFS